jgi:glutathione S-transferase
MYLHAALITVLSTVLLGFAMGLVGRARGRHGIHAPATSGHPDFDRAFRAHMNTLEQVAMFLPVLWVATIHYDAMIAAYLGYAWLVGRLWYVVGYVRAADKRSMGFLVGALAYLALLVLSLWGVGRAMFAG